MSSYEPLDGRVIAISISESPDIGSLGMGNEHLTDAMTEVARHLLALGAGLAYGGDLRKEGFSRLLFELVSRHRRDGDLVGGRIGVTNYLPWPVHLPMSADSLWDLSKSLEGTAKVVCLALDGTEMSPGERQRLSTRTPTRDDWLEGLTAMRHHMLSATSARIVIGGRVDRFKGKYPGVAEETLLSLEAKQPVFVVGGFGGCAGDIAAILTRDTRHREPARIWEGLAAFEAFTFSDMANGLTDEENLAVLKTPYIDQAIALILRGLLRLWNPAEGTSDA